MNLHQLLQLACNSLIEAFRTVQDSEGKQDEMTVNFTKGGAHYRITIAYDKASSNVGKTKRSKLA